MIHLMMADHIPRLILILVLLGLSGFFSGSETALFSLGLVQKRRIGVGVSGTDRALRWLLSQPRRLIATLLVGNELVNISISTVIAALVHDFYDGRSQLYQALVSMAIVVTVVLLLGEVTPKTIAIKIPEAWSRAVARPLRVFSAGITPLRWMVRSFADGVINLLGGRPPERERPLSEEEFISLVDQGSRRGELDDEERDLIHSVFEFGDRRVADVMTPVAKVFALSYSLPLERIVSQVIDHHFSRVPIYKGRRRQVIGVLYAKDLVGFGHVLELTGKSLEDLLRKPFFVPRSTKCSRLFREFRERRIHIGIVVDEYGTMVGLVTMQDLLEELFGELGDDEAQSSRDGPPSVGREDARASRQDGKAIRDEVQANGAEEQTGRDHDEGGRP
ncbi:MAG: HlyC/CorC family transporter [Deltaproteobacteria bacterium]|nr:HlyC/CorC family transporter [Deltaproteobacteria bacterium]